jgi:FkbM family methyltransferase
MEITSKYRQFVKWLVPPILLDGVRYCSAKYRLGSNMYKSADEEEKILKLLDNYPPLSPTEVTLRHRRLSVLDGPSFAAIYREQFNEQVFRFEPSSSSPLIIDCGAHVGLVSVYFKSVFPDARIVAFEPDPACFCALSANCSQFHDVILYQSAVWIERGTFSFSRVGVVGGYLSELAHSDSRLPTITVSAVRLRDFLVEPVEFLKLDIEGSEFDVLADCERNLHYVRRLFVELHSFTGRPQRLSEAISIIERAGFRIHAHGVQERQPFLGIPSTNGKDFHLNLFCYRPPG